MLEATSRTRFFTRFFSSPDKDRLEGFITEIAGCLNAQLDGKPAATIDEQWAKSAAKLLGEARALVSLHNTQAAWSAALAARRAVLSNPRERERLRCSAIMLRREVDKLSGWRAKAIRDLICDDKGTLQNFEEKCFENIIEAMALRDDASQNVWYKIHLRRRHLWILSSILWLSIGALAGAIYERQLPDFLLNHKMMFMVVLFGVLGAALSVAQSLLSQNVDAKIPLQELGSLAILIRPGVGAAAAIAAFVVLNANEHFKLLANVANEPSVVGALSLLAGYSERFIVGTLDRISFAASGSQK